VAELGHWGLLSFRILRRDGFICSLEQIMRDRAKVFQVSRYYYVRPVEGKYKILQLHSKKSRQKILKDFYCLVAV
jgi:hypothetical protein